MTSPQARDAGVGTNTDKELWRERDGDYYANSVFVTEGNGIGMNCGGRVVVKPVRDWIDLAWPANPARDAVSDAEVEAAAEIIWNDAWGARAGSWKSLNGGSISAIQTRATARTALLAASRVRPAGAGEDVAKLLAKMDDLLSRQDLTFTECSLAEEWCEVMREARNTIGTVT